MVSEEGGSGMMRLVVVAGGPGKSCSFSSSFPTPAPPPPPFLHAHHGAKHGA